MNAVDANVFIYALDVDEPLKQAKLYSEDFDHGTDYDGVSVVNPFV